VLGPISGDPGPGHTLIIKEALMKTLAAGSKVGPGYYLDIAEWSFAHVREGGSLPTTGRFIKTPILAVLAGAPILGLMMVMFLPFIGFALTLGLVAKRAGAALQQSFYGLAALVSPAMRPGEAYLAGKARDVADAQAKDAALNTLESEIAAKRAKK
jgi:hypothetical protein